MTATTSHLNVELAKQFAWLLRKDLQATFASKDAPGFDEWWLIQGRQQFAGWADSATPAELQTLFEPSHHATVAGVPFAVPKLVGLLANLGVAGLIVAAILYMLRRSDAHDGQRIRDLQALCFGQFAGSMNNRNIMTTDNHQMAKKSLSTEPTQCFNTINLWHIQI